MSLKIFESKNQILKFCINCIDNPRHTEAVQACRIKLTQCFKLRKSSFLTSDLCFSTLVMLLHWLIKVFFILSQAHTCFCRILCLSYQTVMLTLQTSWSSSETRIKIVYIFQDYWTLTKLKYHCIFSMLYTVCIWKVLLSSRAKPNTACVHHHGQAGGGFTFLK